VYWRLDQRIATRYQLAPLDLVQAAIYLRHHLTLVGAPILPLQLARAHRRHHQPAAPPVA
jgi:type II secretory pathway predicted ATPase ExeA